LRRLIGLPFGFSKVNFLHFSGPIFVGILGFFKLFELNLNCLTHFCGNLVGEKCQDFSDFLEIFDMDTSAFFSKF
jgi:hypothetical protein